LSERALARQYDRSATPEPDVVETVALVKYTVEYFRDGLPDI
jgi:hypothetical protein